MSDFFVAALLTVLALAASLMSYEAAQQATNHEWKHRCVEQGVAEWYRDEITGPLKWRWIEPAEQD